MSSTPELLYVDDEEPNLFLFQAQFRDDFKVVTAPGGEEGLKVLKENPNIKIVISDMKMPMMDGLQFIREARKDYPEKEYIILTGYAINEEIQQALENGEIARYLQKPYSSDHVIQIIKDTFARM